ncbi:MAG: antirestriction protein ArdA [Firmicutes bacterium]|nr:antirestriction protein ArdA [Bacillota bacterium]
METQNTHQLTVIIGSWGSYNECNEKALGSNWLDLHDFDDWDSIVLELKKQGFDLDGIDEELFIQDIEGLPSNCASWDYMSPQRLFNTLKESGVLECSHKHDVMLAYLEIYSWSDFESLVDSNGYYWDDGINLYKGFNWADYGREMFDACEERGLSDRLQDFFDFEKYGRYIGDCYCHEYSEGIIEIM